MKDMIRKERKGKLFCEYLTKNSIYYDYCIRHPEVVSCSESANIINVIKII